MRSPGTSTRCCSQELKIPRTSLRRILHKDLYTATYNIQLIQKLKPDPQMRFRFAEWAYSRLQEDPQILLNKAYF